MKKSTMKKLGSMIFACLMVVSTFATFSTVTYAENDSYKTKIHETYLELDPEELAALTADPTTYDISVFIEFVSSAEELAALYSDDPVESRENGKNYHNNKNKKLAEALEMEDAYISKYAPYAEIRYDSIEEYEDSWKQICRIAQSDEVIDLEVTLSERDSSSVRATFPCSEEYPIDDALSDMGITNNQYNGDSISIGVLETGLPDDTSHIPSDQYIAYGETESRHATKVTSLILTVASDVTLHCVATDDYSFLEAIEILMDDMVSIVNMSTGISGVSDYDNRAAYIDYLSHQYQILFVIAAGNDGDVQNGQTHCIQSPGLSVNALTVGALNAQGQVSYESSYILEIGDCFKIDLVAPGERLELTPNGAELSGTSYAAPFVSAIAARLLNEFDLWFEAGLLKAVLIQSCEPLAAQEGPYNFQCGAGVVNYTNSRQILQNGNYFHVTKRGNPSTDTVLATKTVTIPANSTMNIYVHSMIPGARVTNVNTNVAEVYRSTYTVWMGQTSTIWCDETTLSPFLTFNNISSEDIFCAILLYVENNEYPNDWEYVYVTYDFTENP